MKRYALVYDPKDKDYIILDYILQMSSRQWSDLKTVFTSPVTDTASFTTENSLVNTGLFYKLLEFDEMLTYEQFYQTHPEFNI